MDSQKLINALAAVVFAFFGWWSNTIWNTVVLQQAQITQINVSMVRDYVPRAELQSRLDKVDDKLDELLKVKNRDR